MSFKRRIRGPMLVALFFTSTFIVSAFLIFPTRSVNAEPEDTIIWVQTTSYQNLFPGKAYDATSLGVVSLIYDKAAYYASEEDAYNNSISPRMAEKIDFSDDNTVFNITLRQGVKWHDGQPVDAYDAAFTYAYYADSSWVYYGLPDDRPFKDMEVLSILFPSIAHYFGWNYVEDIQIIDQYTVMVKQGSNSLYGMLYGGTFGGFQYGLMDYIIPEHIWNTTEYDFSTGEKYNPAYDNPIGCGPYEFVEHKADDYTKLVAFDDWYYEGYPKIKNVFLKIIKDPATMVLALKGGEIDYMNLRFLPVAGDSFEDDPDFNVIAHDFFAVEFLCLNQWEKNGITYFGETYQGDVGPFKDIDYRRAISLAINQAEIVETTLYDYGSAANNIIPKSMDFWHNPAIPSQEYNVTKANEILDSLFGTKRDSDGVRLNGTDGNRLEHTFITNLGNNARMDALEIIKDNLADVGIKINMRVWDWTQELEAFDGTVYYGEPLPFDGYLIGGYSRSGDPWDMVAWFSVGLPFGPHNTTVDTLINNYFATSNVTMQQEIIYELQEIGYEDTILIFLSEPKEVHSLRSNIKGYYTMPCQNSMMESLPFMYFEGEEESWYEETSGIVGIIGVIAVAVAVVAYFMLQRRAEMME